MGDLVRVFNVADLHRLLRMVFDYIDGGADGEVTLRANSRRGPRHRHARR